MKKIFIRGFFMQIGGFLPDCKLAKYKMQNGNI